MELPVETVGQEKVVASIDRQELETETDGSLQPQKSERSELQCEQCQEKSFKYTCPKCKARTCSLECCRNHKETKKCDGIRPKWTPVPAPLYSGKHASQDKHFLHSVKYALNNLSHLSIPNALAKCLNGDAMDHLSDGEDKARTPDELDELLSVAISADDNPSSNVINSATNQRNNFQNSQRGSRNFSRGINKNYGNRGNGRNFNGPRRGGNQNFNQQSRAPFNDSNRGGGGRGKNWG